MSVGKRFSWHSLILIAALSPTLQAAPKLRLSASTVGPVSIAVGSNGTAQVVEAFNAGDGALALQATSSVSWMTATIGAQRGCTTRAGNCLPVNIALPTASLAKGIFTGIVTLSDPNALDAPQTISVTVQIGGGVPDSATLYLSPNASSASVAFSSSNQLSGTAATQSGGNWLSLSMESAGSFQQTIPFRIVARYQDGMAEGTYRGSVVTTGSPVAADNKTVPVTLTVTSQPIAQPSPDRAAFRIAQGANKQAQSISIGNNGLGSLTVSGATATANAGGTWLSATVANSTVVQVTADVGSLAPGSYTGSVAVTTNAINPITIPVQLDVVAATGPVSLYGGVFNSGSFDQALAPGGVAALFGEQLTFQDAQSGTVVPLVTTLGGTQVLVNEVPAPLYFTSYNQVNFQIPYETAPGEALLRVERDGQRGNTVTIQVAARAPRIIQFGNYGVIVNQDGSLAIPSGTPAKVGSAITIYAVGLGATTPAVATGVGAPGAEPLARVVPAPTVVFGSAFGQLTSIDPFFVGLTPGLVGLYQINVIVPDGVSTGDVGLELDGDGYTSNRVLIPITQ